MRSFNIFRQFFLLKVDTNGYQPKAHTSHLSMNTDLSKRLFFEYREVHEARALNVFMYSTSDFMVNFISFFFFVVLLNLTSESKINQKRKKIVRFFVSVFHRHHHLYWRFLYVYLVSLSCCLRLPLCLSFSLSLSLLATIHLLINASDKR